MLNTQTILESIILNFDIINESLDEFGEYLEKERVIEDNIDEDDDNIPHLVIDNSYLIYYLSKDDVITFEFGESDNEYVVNVENPDYCIVIVFI